MKSNERLLSIDALRGFDMFWIIGGDSFFRALLVAGAWSFSPMLKEQLEHADWEGFRFYDLIFPLFLFLVGCVLPFSLAKYRDQPSAVYVRIFRRTAFLFFLGLIYGGLLKFDWDAMRYAGVLQRIAICYCIAALIFLHTNWIARLVICAVILLGYWALIGLVQTDEAFGVFTKQGNLSGYIDRMLLPGKIYEGYYGYGDNEGILSTIPAVVTALLGVFAGEWLRTERSNWSKALGLVVAGALMLSLGLVWSMWFPIIKNIWSSSFVLVAGGWSALLLALFYVLIDVCEYRSWAFVWVVIGVNAITIYMLKNIIDFRKISTYFLGGIAGGIDVWGAPLLALGVLVAQWGLLWYLYKQKIFLRV